MTSYTPDPQALRALIDAPKIAATCPPDLDSHTWTASKIFGVAYDDVTPDQRSAVKLACFGASPTGQLPDPNRERVGPPLHNIPWPSMGLPSLRAAFSWDGVKVYPYIDDSQLIEVPAGFDYAAMERQLAKSLNVPVRMLTGHPHEKALYSDVEIWERCVRRAQRVRLGARAPKRKRPRRSARKLARRQGFAKYPTPEQALLRKWCRS